MHPTWIVQNRAHTAYISSIPSSSAGLVLVSSVLSMFGATFSLLFLMEISDPESNVQEESKSQVNKLLVPKYVSPLNLKPIVTNYKGV